MKFFRFRTTKSDVYFVKGINDPDKRVSEKCAYELYEHCWKYFIRYYHSVFFAGEEEAPDIFQESYLLLWENIRNGVFHVVDDILYKNGEPCREQLTTSLMNIAWKKYMELTRSRPDPEKQKLVQEYLDELAKEIYDPNRDLVYEELVRRLSDMSDECYRILSLVYYDKLKYPEIIKLMPMYKNIDSLKSKKYNCIERLRKIMDPYKSRLTDNNLE